MLECWNEYPIDRPNFSAIRSKFSDLLMANTSDSYMVIEIDENKTYYQFDELEERNRKDSKSSVSSDGSIKKAKQPKKIEKPKWAQDVNAYTDVPSTFKDGAAHVDENYRDTTAIDTRVKDESNGTMRMTDAEISEDSRNVPSHLPLTQNTSLPLTSHVGQTTPSLEDQIGIPLSFVMTSPEKPTSRDNDKVSSKKTNPYIDDPRTLHPLEKLEEGKVLGVAHEGNPQLSKMSSITAEINSRLSGDRKEDSDVAMSVM